MSVTVQFVAKLLLLVLNALASVAVIRYLGPHGFGDYVFAFSFSTLIGMISELGLSRVAVREMERDEEGAPAILGTTLAARVGLAIFCMILAQAVLAILNSRSEIRIAVGVASLLLVTEALLSVGAVFQVKLAMQYAALVDLVVQALKTGLLFFLISRHAGLVVLIGSWVVAGIVGVVVANVLARSTFKFRLKVELRRLPGLLKESLPFGIAVLLAISYLKIDSILLAVMRSPREVGIYGAAYKPIEYLMLASAILTLPLFPLLVRWYKVNRERFTVVYRRGMESLLGYGLPICVAFLLLADPLVTALYGPDYAASALPLKLLGVALVFLLFHVWQGLVLLAADRQDVPLKYNLAGLVFNVGLNILLIARFGYLGAAVAALATAVFIAVCAGVATQVLVKVSLGYGRLLRLLAANATLGLTLWMLLQLGVSWLPAGVLGAVSYAGFLLVFRITTIDELRRLLPKQQGAELAEAS
jgi:O-antigen/teichoic acid export membrane protein